MDLFEQVTALVTTVLVTGTTLGCWLFCLSEYKTLGRRLIGTPFQWAMSIAGCAIMSGHILVANVDMRKVLDIGIVNAFGAFSVLELIASGRRRRRGQKGHDEEAGTSGTKGGSKRSHPGD
jgi:hypothetical protein